MAKTITVIGEENSGVTTTALMLGKYIAQYSKKRTLVVDLNYKKADIHNILTDDEEPKYNIDVIMNYAISEKELSTVINTNVEKVKNLPNLKIIMGSYIKEEFSNIQYINFFNNIQKEYDFIIIDSYFKACNTIFDYSDLILLILDQSLKNVRNISNKYWKVLKNEKTQILINKYEKSIGTNTVSKFLSKKITYFIDYDPNITKALNSKTLSVEEGPYNKSICKVTKNILTKYSIDYKENWNISKLFKKRKGEVGSNA